MRIGAVMSAEVCDSLKPSIEQHGGELVWLDPSLTRARDFAPEVTLDGVVIDLDEVGPKAQRQLSQWAGGVPMAAIGTSLARSDPESDGVQTTLIASEDDLVAWLTVLGAARESSSISERGCVVVVVGPEGAPGRTLTTRALARESALSGCATVVIDADTAEPGFTFSVGLAGAKSGLRAALRSARVDSVTIDAVRKHTQAVMLEEQQISLLSGYVPDPIDVRLGDDSIRRLVSLFRHAGHVTIVDTPGIPRAPDAWEPETDAWREKSPAERWMEQADYVVAVMSATEHGLSRGIRMWHQLLQSLPADKWVLCVTTTTPSAHQKDATARTVWDYMGTDMVHFLEPRTPRSRGDSYSLGLPDELLAGLWGTIPLSRRQDSKTHRRRRATLRRWALKRAGRKRLP